ncbi:MAG: hypothetical protein ACUVX8_11575 [Candidatus Zipacnadales bacterium]
MAAKVPQDLLEEWQTLRALLILASAGLSFPLEVGPEGAQLLEVLWAICLSGGRRGLGEWPCPELTNLLGAETPEQAAKAFARFAGLLSKLLQAAEPIEGTLPKDYVAYREALKALAKGVNWGKLPEDLDSVSDWSELAELLRELYLTENTSLSNRGRVPPPAGSSYIRMWLEQPSLAQSEAVDKLIEDTNLCIIEEETLLPYGVAPPDLVVLRGVTDEEKARVKEAIQLLKRWDVKGPGGISLDEWIILE